MRIPYRPDALYYPPRRWPTGKIKKVKVTATEQRQSSDGDDGGSGSIFLEWSMPSFDSEDCALPGPIQCLNGILLRTWRRVFSDFSKSASSWDRRAIDTTNLTCRLSLLFVLPVDRIGPLDSCRSRLAEDSPFLPFFLPSSLFPSFLAIFLLLNNLLDIYIPRLLHANVNIYFPNVPSWRSHWTSPSTIRALTWNVIISLVIIFPSPNKATSESRDWLRPRSIKVLVWYVCHWYSCQF